MNQKKKNTIACVSRFLRLSLSVYFISVLHSAGTVGDPLETETRQKQKARRITMARGKPGFIKPMFERAKWKILRGDTVAVTAGRDAGATGTVLKVIRDERRPTVLVEGCNLVRWQEWEGEGREKGRRGD